MVIYVKKTHKAIITLSYKKMNILRYIINMFKSDVVDYTKPLKDENKPDNVVLKHRKDSIKIPKINSVNSTKYYNQYQEAPLARRLHDKYGSAIGLIATNMHIINNPYFTTINKEGKPENENTEGYHNSKL